MGIFSRVSDIVDANINDMLDRAEDPEKMVKLLIIEMEEHIEKAREGLVKAVAGEKGLEANLKRNREAAAEWEAKAESAVKRGDEELARKCLARKKEHERIADSMQPQWEAAHKTSEVLKKDFKRLEEKVDEACRRRDALIARQLAAEAQRHVATIGPSMSKAQRSFSKFDRMERKVEQLEGEALALVELSDANRDLEEEIERSERSAEVEAELDALKERMGRQKTGS